MSLKSISIQKSKINEELYSFVNNEIIPDTGIEINNFWEGFIDAANKLAVKNKLLLEKRDDIQKKIDNWHINNKDNFNLEDYKNFLKEINYIVEEQEDFTIETENVDQEISNIAGPQLVVPIDNARYALNAANARWGSLYDAFYGTDVIDDDDDCVKTTSYNPKKGQKSNRKRKDTIRSGCSAGKGNWSEASSFLIEKGI